MNFEIYQNILKYIAKYLKYLKHRNIETSKYRNIETSKHQNMSDLSSNRYWGVIGESKIAKLLFIGQNRLWRDRNEYEAAIDKLKNDNNYDDIIRHIISCSNCRKDIPPEKIEKIIRSTLLRVKFMNVVLFNKKFLNYVGVHDVQYYHKMRTDPQFIDVVNQYNKNNKNIMPLVNFIAIKFKIENSDYYDCDSDCDSQCSDCDSDCDGHYEDHGYYSHNYIPGDHRHVHGYGYDEDKNITNGDYDENEKNNDRKIFKILKCLKYLIKEEEFRFSVDSIQIGKLYKIGYDEDYETEEIILYNPNEYMIAGSEFIKSEFAESEFAEIEFAESEFA